MVKNLPGMQETWIQSLGQEDPLKKEMATLSSFLAWRISQTEEPGGLQSMGLQTLGHDWVTNTQTHHFIYDSPYKHKKRAAYVLESHVKKFSKNSFKLYAFFDFPINLFFSNSYQVLHLNVFKSIIRYISFLFHSSTTLIHLCSTLLLTAISLLFCFYISK